MAFKVTPVQVVRRRNGKPGCALSRAGVRHHANDRRAPAHVAQPTTDLLRAHRAGAARRSGPTREMRPRR